MSESRKMRKMSSFLSCKEKKFSSVLSTICHSVPIITCGSFRGQRGKKQGSFQGRDQFGDHFGGCTVLDIHKYKALVNFSIPKQKVVAQITSACRH